jgi:DNA polymerase-3 subunit epsilon
MTWANGRLVGFDLETTSPNPREAKPVSFALAFFEGRELTQGRAGLINPGVPIPPETTDIHGITDEMAQERGGDLQRSVEGLAAELVAASLTGMPVVGCNLRYDLTVIDTLTQATTGESLWEMGWCGPAVDVLVIDRGVDKYRKGKRTLTALAAHYGVALLDAHSASADTTAAVLIAQALADKYPEVGKASLPELHLKQKKWHREWAEHYSEYRVKRGDEPLPESELEWPFCAP